MCWRYTRSILGRPSHKEHTKTPAPTGGQTRRSAGTQERARDRTLGIRFLESTQTPLGFGPRAANRIELWEETMCISTLNACVVQCSVAVSAGWEKALQVRRLQKTGTHSPRATILSVQNAETLVRTRQPTAVHSFPRHPCRTACAAGVLDNRLPITNLRGHFGVFAYEPTAWRVFRYV